MGNLNQVINDPGLARAEWEAMPLCAPYTLCAGFVEGGAETDGATKNPPSLSFSY